MMHGTQFVLWNVTQDFYATATLTQIVNDIWKAEIAGYGKIMTAMASGKQIMHRLRNTWPAPAL